MRTTKYRLEDGCAVCSGKLTKSIDFKTFTEALWWCTDSEDICWLTGGTLARAFRENLAHWKDDGGNHPEGLDGYNLRAVIFEKRSKSEWTLIAPELPPGQRFRLRVQPPQLRHEGGRVSISDVVVPSL